MIDLKKTAEEMKRIKGNVRGDAILNIISYIRQEKGDKGIKEVRQKIGEIGMEFDISDIKPLRWYPESLGVMIILSAKNLFEWTNEDIFKMGESSIKSSFMIKMIMRYFTSLDMVLKEAPKYWEKYFDFGELEVVERDTEKIVIRVKDYRFHPDICSYHAGYFSSFTMLSLGIKDINVEQTESIFDGGPWHEYLISWKK